MRFVFLALALIMFVSACSNTYLYIEKDFLYDEGTDEIYTDYWYALWNFRFDQALDYAKQEKSEDKTELALLVKSLNDNSFQIRDTTRLAKLISNSPNDTIQKYAKSWIKYYTMLNYLVPAYLDSFSVKHEDLYRCTTINLRDSLPFIDNPPPIIEVSINGKVFSFMINLGSPTTIISKKVTDSLRLKIIDNVLLPISNHRSIKIQPSNSLLPSITFDKIKIENIPIDVLDNEAFYKYMELLSGSTKEVLGILGWDIIKRFNVRLDYEENFLILNQRHKSKVLNRQVLGLIRPHVQVLFENGLNKMMDIDTGIRKTTLFSHNFSEELESLDSENLTFISIVGEFAETVYSKEYNFYIGDYHCSFPKAMLRNNRVRMMNSAGSIGNDVFILGGFILDWEAGHFKNYVYKSEE